MGEDRRRRALEFAHSIPYLCLATVMEGGRPSQRIMHWSRIDDDFTIWTSTMFSSHKVRHIEKNPNVCAMFIEEVGYLRVNGRAEIISDQKTKDEFWKDEWDLYWPKGKADPDYVLLKIVPESIDYLNMSDGDTIASPV